MRLINVHTLLLEEFASVETAPPYAILSHTWRAGHEVTYQDFQDLDVAQGKEGFRKIHFACEEAKQDGLRFAWADTCCIDKTSSSELSEAINSMFKWYMKAVVCYVYLADVSGNCPLLPDLNGLLHPRLLDYTDAFEASRWFTRGWTLQELIAPKQLYFFGQAWNFVGTRQSLTQRVSRITGIQSNVLDQTKPLADVSVGRRLSWAASRSTTRKEDEAYSLLGILGVNLPLLYGEGEEAFIRLQEQIISKSTDQSIFAWNAPSGFLGNHEYLLAPSPQCFRNAAKIKRRRYVGDTSFKINNKGLDITLPVIRRRLLEDPSQPYVTLGILDCKYEDSSEVLALVMNQHPFGISSNTLALELYVAGFKHDIGTGLQHSRLLSIPVEELDDAQPQQLTITKDLHSLSYIQAISHNEPTWFPVLITGDLTRLPSLSEVFPDRCWSQSSKTLRLRMEHDRFGAVKVRTAEGIHALICFSVVRFRERNIRPEKKLLGMTFIDQDCPIRPHLNRIVRKCEEPSDTWSLRLNRRESLVARLWQGALTVCVENGGGSTGSITAQPPTMSPLTSPLLSTPTSPQLYHRRPSNSSVRQDSFRRDSFLTDSQAHAWMASLMSDDASSTSSSEGQPHVSRLKTCAHCVQVREDEQAEEAQRVAAEQEKFEAAEAVRRKKERNAKVLAGAKKASVGASLGGMLWDLAEGLEFLV